MRLFCRDPVSGLLVSRVFSLGGIIEGIGKVVFERIETFVFIGNRGFCRLAAIINGSGIGLVGSAVILPDNLTLFDEINDIGWSWREECGCVDEVLFLKVIDKDGTGLPHLLARRHIRFLSCCLQCLARQAQQKLFRAHVRQEGVRADRFAGNARDDTAIRHPAPARQDINQHGAGSDTQRFAIKGKLAVLADQPGSMALEALRPKDRARFQR